MKNSTLIVLGLIGVGLYLFLKNKKPNVADLTVTNLPPQTPDNSLVTASSTDNKYNVHFALNGMRKIGKIPNTI
jgi:hypothetical protein